MISKEVAQVVDFGCGTGLVGEAMKKAGFENVTGIDCSEGMLQIAEKKDVYRSLELSMLGG